MPSKKIQEVFDMKKIIGLALALAAAALVFVGCGDEAGEGGTSGSKWDTTMTVDGTKNAKPAVDVQRQYEYRRFWDQFGTKEAVSGITTTITVRKDELSSTKENTAVFGLMFDYNDGVADDTKDFCLIGFNMARKQDSGSAKPQFYACRYIGIPYKKDLDTDNQDLNPGTPNVGPDGEKDFNFTVGGGTWKDLVKNTHFKEVKYDFGTKDDDGKKIGEEDAYQIVVNIRPVLDFDDASKKGTGYTVQLGADVNKARSNDVVATYTIGSNAADSTRNTKYYKEITVKNVKYMVPCGGLAVYGNAKTQYFNKNKTGGPDLEGTKIVANYNTVSPSGGAKYKFTNEQEFNESSLIGDLKLTNTSNDNITVIVE